VLFVHACYTCWPNQPETGAWVCVLSSNQLPTECISSACLCHAALLTVCFFTVLYAYHGMAILPRGLAVTQTQPSCRNACSVYACGLCPGVLVEVWQGGTCAVAHQASAFC
jgi:hypothetical protein